MHGAVFSCRCCRHVVTASVRKLGPSTLKICRQNVMIGCDSTFRASGHVSVYRSLPAPWSGATPLVGPPLTSVVGGRGTRLRCSALMLVAPRLGSCGRRRDDSPRPFCRPCRHGPRCLPGRVRRGVGGAAGLLLRALAPRVSTRRGCWPFRCVLCGPDAAGCLVTGGGVRPRCW